jgi:prepilin-type N-terminal cleavage/methylation domain-containing protein
MKVTAKGFTLIELLIVISVLGILAVAVLSAINPIEQINRSRDTGSRSDAEQLLGAVDRFYATQGYYPWKTSPILPAVTEATAWGIVADAVAVAPPGWGDGTTSVLGKLSVANTGEVKQSFTNRITSAGYNSLYKYHEGGSGDSLYICFLPKSGAFKVEAATRCVGTTPDDFPPLACPVACTVATPDTCWSCLP